MHFPSPTPRLLLRGGLLLALAPFVLLMAFTQPFFDDFRGAYWTYEHGLWGMQKWFYLTWSGRFTSTFFMTALNPVTYGWLEGVRPVVLGIFVLQWTSIAFLFRTVFHTIMRLACSWGKASWTAVLLLVLFCNAAPSPFSFLYWFSGVVVYQFTLLSLLTFAALALRAGWGPVAQQWRCAFLACGPLVLALAGSELTMMQAVPLLALLGYALPPTARPKLGIWLTVAGVTVAIAFAAPGNWLRVTATAPTDPLHAYRWLVLGPRTVYSVALFLIEPMVALSLVAAAGAGLWLGVMAQSAAGSHSLRCWSRRQWWAVGLAFGVLNTIGFLLFRYLIVGPPLIRARNEIMLLMLVSVAMLAWVAAAQRPASAAWVTRLPRWPSMLLLMGMFGAGHVPEAWRELWTSAVPFDAQMQARYAILRTAHRTGQKVVTLPPLRVPYGRVLIPLSQFKKGIEFDIDLTPGCEGNINGVMERYFEVPDVCCSPDAPALAPTK